MSEKFIFAVESAEIIDEMPSDSQFATAKVRAFNTGKSLHNTLCSRDVLEKTAPTIYEKPIIFEINPIMGDFGSHSDLTIPAGFVIPGSATYADEADGRTSLNVLVKIWKKYSGKFLEIFADTSRDKKPVSVEMEVFQYEKLADNLINLLDFAYSAICVLGDRVTPASPSSELEMLTFAKNETETYHSLFEKEFSKYGDIDFTIPENVKKAAQRAIDEQTSSSPVALAMARFLIKNASITPERVISMNKFFGKKSSSDVGYNLWGGNAARKWSKELLAKMSEADDKEIRYYADKEKMSEESNSLAANNDLVEDKLDMAKTEKENNEVTTQETEEVTNAETNATETFAAQDENEEENEQGSDNEQDEQDEKKFNYAQYFDTEAVMSMFAEEETDDEDTRKAFAAGRSQFEFCDDSGLMMSAMFAAMKKMQAKMAKMAADAEVYMSENEDLKKFKANVEAQQKQFAVAEAMKELEKKAKLPDEVRDEIVAEAEKYSLEQLDSWKNFAKAKSFDFAVTSVESDNQTSDDVAIIGFSFYKETPAEKDLWAGV